MPDLTGEVIDNRYQLRELMASGGMASIYRATDLRLDREVAVKIMHSHLANDEDFVGRFIREARAAAALSHPNVVSIQDQGWNEGGQPAVFLVMELVDGFTLRDLLNEKSSLSIEDSLRYLNPILSALSAAHRIGILHRDLKPENILISKDGRLKVADFGLARLPENSSTLTAESSVILGSVSYLSPEQVQRGISDLRSDVYALGIIFFEMLTGRKPFEGDSPIQIAFKHVNENIPAPSTLNKQIPKIIDEFVLKATANNPDHRFRDAGAMLDQFQILSSALDPNQRQLSLELDLPLTKAKSNKKGKNFLKSITTQLELRRGEVMKEKTTQTRKKKKLSNRVKRNRAIASAIVLFLLFGSFYLIGSGGNKIKIPSLAGLSVKEVGNTLSPLGLKVAVKDQVFSEDVPNGKVIFSDPAGGGGVGKNGTVYLTISKGPERIQVPELLGLTLDSATVTLNQAHLKVGSTTQSYSANVDAGLVISSSPKAGSDAKKDELINLKISKGIQQITVSSYVGMSSDQALNELTSNGAIVTSKYAYSDTVPSGTVISQTPDGSIPLAKGDKVLIVISKGPSSIFIPNVYSLTQEKATSILENLGFNVKYKTIGSKKIKTVTNVSPKVGSKVKPGSTITLTLS